MWECMFLIPPLGPSTPLSPSRHPLAKGKWPDLPFPPCPPPLLPDFTVLSEKTSKSRRAPQSHLILDQVTSVKVSDTYMGVLLRTVCT